MPEMTSDVAERFWAKVATAGPDDCWDWTAARSGAGYGRFKIAGKLHGANRIAFELGHGRAPRTHEDICHSCDNPTCCNPAHLFAGTRSDNMRDCSEKGRLPSHIGVRTRFCAHGHDKHAVGVDQSGYCKACHRIRTRLDARRRRAA